MKRIRQLFLVLVVLAVVFVALPLISCGDSSSGGNGPGGGDEPGGDSETFPAARGKLTVNGLNNFNGNYVYVSGLVAGNKQLQGLTGMTGYPSDITFNLVQITNGTAVVPLYSLNSSATSSSDYFIAYNGNDNINSLHIVILSDSSLKLANAGNALSNNLGIKTITNTGTFSSGNLILDWIPPHTSNSIEDMKTWLEAQSNNTSASPYKIILNVNSLGGRSDTDGSIGKLLRDNPNKYVNLDLSGSNFTSIEEKALWACYNLTGVTIPNSVNSIGNSAFSNCNSTSITIPNSVSSIGEYAFFGCTSLSSVTIGNSVTSIGYAAFSWGTSLTAITVVAGNTAYISQDDILYNKDKTTLVVYPGGKTGAFTIPDSVQSIGEGAFYGCSITEITIPDSVTSIGYNAFRECSELINVNIPNSVTSIGSGAFDGCTSLASVTIPDSVTSIEGGAFSECSKLTNVYIPNSVTSIGYAAFSRCDRLVSVTFATGSNIADDNFEDMAFPEGSYGNGGNTLKTAYATGKAGTYTREENGSTWTKQE